METKKRIIQVKEFQTKVLHGVDADINNFLKKKGITKDNIVDIKYVSSISGTLVLLVYEEEV